MILELFSKLVLEDLSGSSQWNRIDEYDVIWHPPLWYLTFIEGQHLRARDISAGLLDNHQEWSLVPLGVMGGNTGCRSDRGVAGGNAFHLDRADPLAPLT